METKPPLCHAPFPINRDAYLFFINKCLYTLHAVEYTIAKTAGYLWVSTTLALTW